MKTTDQFALAELPPPHHLRAWRRRVLIDGRATGVVIDGEEIALQLICGDLRLLITHYDSYDCVDHWFYLFDRRGGLIDALSTPADFGFIQQICIESERSLSFGFYGTNDRWTLSLDEAGHWSFSLSDIARRINRFVWRRRYMTVHCVKGEPWTSPASGR